MFQNLKRFMVTLFIVLFTTSMITGTVEARANNLPKITEGSSISQTTDEDTKISFELNATDADRDAKLRWSTSTAQNGTVTKSTPTNSAGNSKITITYDPKANYNGIDTFIVTVKDSSNGSASITVNMNITAVNDAPVNTVPPTVSGSYLQGQIITTSDGTWTDDSISTLTISYQWQLATDANGSSITTIEGATNNSYTIQPADVGKYLRVVVLATEINDGTTPGLVSSMTTAWVLIKLESTKTINYVALGDSIATGTIYPGANITSYVTYIYQYLQQQNPTATVTYKNLAADGARSNEIYKKLGLDTTITADTAMLDAIRNANIITISIGGNNLMQACKDSTALGGYNFNKINTTTAENGVNDFNSQWVPIIKKIKELNGTAKIIVNTIYNPFNYSDSYHALVDTYLNGVTATATGSVGINKFIKDNSILGYSVADVYTSFDSYGNKNNMGAITYFYPGPFDFMGQLTRNPHPNATGQNIITNCVKSLIS